MHINGQTRVFLILGDPVAQVRAPEMFNHLFVRHDVNAVLVPAQVPAVHFAPFARSALSARNIDGLWLAIPHKAAMVGLLDHCDALGKVAQAVNAARRNADGSIEGALFDGIGFVRALDRFDVPLASTRALVVGVGGGGMAIAASLAERGVKELALFDIDTARVAALAQRIRSAWPLAHVMVASSSDPQGFDLIINATPLGLKAGDPLPLDPTRVSRDAVVVDILMKNQPTPLLQRCKAQGARVFPGFEMLVQQAAQYLNFFGLHELARTVEGDQQELRRLLQAAY